MVDRAYLRKGLWAMARAHMANNMSGHLGAALIAGYCFAEEHADLDDRVHVGIQDELDRVIAGEEPWFDPEKAGLKLGEFFEPFADAAPQPERIPTIADALSHNLHKLRQSGHNVIFAAMAIGALQEYPQHATPPVIDGIRKLIEGFNAVGPGRQYFGRERGWVMGDDVCMAPDDSLPPYADERAMVQTVIDELIRTASEHRQGCGGLHHVINHAAALARLSRLGYSDLARKGLAAHRDHVRLWRALPNLEKELGPVKPAQHDPRSPEFWTTGTLRRDRGLLTHRIKTLYGFSTLARLVDDAARREAAEEKFLYLMA